MPYETTSVCLPPIGGVEGSDYINAVPSQVDFGHDVSKATENKLKQNLS